MLGTSPALVQAKDAFEVFHSGFESADPSLQGKHATDPLDVDAFVGELADAPERPHISSRKPS
jgi:hypothetical protein